jgi:hypothetical protein
VTKVFKDAKNSLSTCKFTLLGYASVFWAFDTELFFFPFFFGALLMVVDGFADLFTL